VNIEIHKPDLVQRVNAQIQRRNLHGVDELLEQALDALDEKSPSPVPRSTASAGNLVELFEPLRGLFSNEEIDALFSRNPSASRPLDFA
jgi:hypothetical protein